ncbi:MAG TPA: hypothetical protein VFC96_01560 [Anaerovoracaceae bacterium]|nr:hypothetical protein [Anaerovoracaceae bacterium]
MDFKWLLPDDAVSIKKCRHFYKYEDAAKMSQKNYRNIMHSYIVTASLLFLSSSVMIYDIFKGNRNSGELILLIVIFAMILLFIYKMRYGAIDRKVKICKDEIVNALPELIDKVVLLLNAGMFIEPVITKVALDNKNNTDSNILLYGLHDLIIKAGESNSSLIHELSVYAIRSGVRELIRFASIVENNFNKGSDLVEKLEGEGILLWTGKKKLAEEKAKLAGTKLSFPLMLLLLSLIVITSAPMLMSI